MTYNYFNHNFEFFRLMVEIGLVIYFVSLVLYFIIGSIISIVYPSQRGRRLKWTIRVLSKKNENGSENTLAGTLSKWDGTLPQVASDNEGLQRVSNTYPILFSFCYVITIIIFLYAPLKLFHSLWFHEPHAAKDCPDGAINHILFSIESAFHTTLTHTDSLGILTAILGILLAIVIGVIAEDSNENAWKSLKSQSEELKQRLESLDKLSKSQEEVLRKVIEIDGKDSMFVPIDDFGGRVRNFKSLVSLIDIHKTHVNDIIYMNYNLTFGLIQSLSLNNFISFHKQLLAVQNTEEDKSQILVSTKDLQATYEEIKKSREKSFEHVEEYVKRCHESELVLRVAILDCNETDGNRSNYRKWLERLFENEPVTIIKNEEPYDISTLDESKNNFFVVENFVRQVLMDLVPKQEQKLLFSHSTILKKALVQFLWNTNHKFLERLESLGNRVEINFLDEIKFPFISTFPKELSKTWKPNIEVSTTRTMVFFHNYESPNEHITNMASFRSDHLPVSLAYKSIFEAISEKSKNEKELASRFWDKIGFDPALPIRIVLKSFSYYFSDFEPHDTIVSFSDVRLNSTVYDLLTDLKFGVESVSDFELFNTENRDFQNLISLGLYGNLFFDWKRLNRGLPFEVKGPAPIKREFFECPIPIERSSAIAFKADYLATINEPRIFDIDGLGEIEESKTKGTDYAIVLVSKVPQFLIMGGQTADSSKALAQYISTDKIRFINEIVKAKEFMDKDNNPNSVLVYKMSPTHSESIQLIFGIES